MFQILKISLQRRCFVVSPYQKDILNLLKRWFWTYYKANAGNPLSVLIFVLMELWQSMPGRLPTRLLEWMLVATFVFFAGCQRTGGINMLEKQVWQNSVDWQLWWIFWSFFVFAWLVTFNSRRYSCLSHRQPQLLTLTPCNGTFPQRCRCLTEAPAVIG